MAVLQALVAHAMGDKKQVSLWQTAVDAANGSTAYGSVTTYVTDPNFAPYLAVRREMVPGSWLFLYFPSLAICSFALLLCSFAPLSFCLCVCSRPQFSCGARFLGAFVCFAFAWGQHH